MKCTNCGTEMPDSETVCQACGAVAAVPEPVQAKPLILREDTQESYVWYIQKKLVYIIGIALAACIMLSVVGTLVVSFLNRVDVTKYLEITADGYDGYGKISYSLKDGELLCDVYDLEDTSELSNLSSEERAQAQKLVSALKNSISADSSLTNLSNGDRRVFTFNNLKEIEKSVGIKLKNKNQVSYEVEKLLEATTIYVSDLFDISFAGYDGAGCVVAGLSTSRQLPFEVSCYGNTFYIDNRYEYSFVTSGNEGTLSNGDSFTVQVRGAAEAADYLRSAYGIHLAADDAIEYKVEGLTESQHIDIFSMTDLSVSGLDGEARVKIQWKETEKAFGNIRVAAENAESNSFYIYSTAAVPSSPFGFAYEQAAAEEEYRIGSFTIRADKESGIYSGDEITFRITSYYYDNLATDTFAAGGVVFDAVETKVTVDNSMVERYITSAKQVNKENINVLSETLKDSVATYLKNNWSRIIHGNSGFVCYDQTITDGPTAAEAYFVCTSSKSNSYTMWIVFTGSAKDSETTKAARYYIVAQISNPTIIAGEDNVISATRSAEFSYYESMDDMRSSSWYEKYQEKMTTFTLN